jgi:Uma2 family endonuclease
MEALNAIVQGERNMATAGTKLLSAEEFFDWANRPENRDRRFELEEGEIVEMSRPGERHGVVCGNTTGLLWNYTRQVKKGYVCTNDTGLILKRDPDTVKGPDVSLYLESKRYEDLEIKYPEKLPDLIVEVMSPNDKVGKMMRRISNFLARGVPMVWLVDPDDKSVTIYRANHLPMVVEEPEELANLEELPGFRCQVAELFHMMGEENKEGIRET